MSDEFLKAARREIRDELSEIENIFTKCFSDKHIQENATDMESHVHKIKGLAPMMDYDSLGSLANIVDLILKHINKKGVFPESYSILLDAFQKMKTLFDEGDKSVDISDFVNMTKKKIADITKS
ncbi:MAG: hypothetical protein ABI340_01860 [Nitrososphaera sp.]|jgi:chemotaxis protein histidine kinase CheA